MYNLVYILNDYSNIYLFYWKTQINDYVINFN